MSWAASLPLTAVASLGPLRFLPSTEALVLEQVIWLRGQELSDADELRLRQVPGADRFQVNSRGELIPAGALLPCGRLPAGNWQPLRDWLKPELPALRIVAGSWPKIPLSLVRDTQLRNVSALLTTIDVWQDYALAAPQVRLNPLQFAMNSQRQVLIVGTPLPPLAGERFWEEQGLFLAAGWTWSPAVDAALVREALQLTPNDVALWHADRWELLRRSDFVAARRAAVRASAAGAQSP